MRIALIVVVASALVLANASSTAAATNRCRAVDIVSGTCVDVTNTGSSVSIGATETTPGSSSTTTSTSTSTTTSTTPGTTTVPGSAAVDEYVPPEWTTLRKRVDDQCGTVQLYCVTREGAGEDTAEEEDAEQDDGETENEPEVTVSDVAVFAPAEATVAMEPDGWVVTGLPANFYSTARPDLATGSLLGETADVRFTPVAFAWSYGDGDSRTVATPGATWADLRQDEFTETPTSHVYEEPGTFTVRLTVGYRAEYRYLGGGWVPVAGTVGIPDDPFEVVAGSASTVLVGAECSAASDDDTC